MASLHEQMKNGKKGDFICSNTNNRYIMGKLQLRLGIEMAAPQNVHMEIIIYYSCRREGLKTSKNVHKIILAQITQI